MRGTSGGRLGQSRWTRVQEFAGLEEEGEGVTEEKGGRQRRGSVVSTLRLSLCCSALASSRRPLPFDPPNNQYILT